MFEFRRRDLNENVPEVSKLKLISHEVNWQRLVFPPQFQLQNTVVSHVNRPTHALLLANACLRQVKLSHQTCRIDKCSQYGIQISSPLISVSWLSHLCNAYWFVPPRDAPATKLVAGLFTNRWVEKIEGTMPHRVAILDVRISTELTTITRCLRGRQLDPNSVQSWKFYLKFVTNSYLKHEEVVQISRPVLPGAEIDLFTSFLAQNSLIFVI